MSDIVLRGLLLDNKYQAAPTSSTSTLKSLSLDNTATDSAPTHASSLTSLDSLRLSQGSGGSSKGSIPIQLLSPNDINVGSSNPSKGSVLSGLSGARPIRNTSQNNTKLSSLSDLQASSNAVTNYTNVAPSSHSQGVKVNSSFVQSTDKTTEKLSIAIEKIGIWDKKIGALSSELQKQNDMKQSSGNIDPARLMTRTKQVKEARTAAVLSRDDAMKAYNEAITEIKANFGSNGASSASARQYKSSFDRMETMFAETDAKDQGVMHNVLGFLKNSMTPENFSVAVGYLNPFHKDSP